VRAAAAARWRTAARSAAKMRAALRDGAATIAPTQDARRARRHASRKPMLSAQRRNARKDAGALMFIHAMFLSAQRRERCGNHSRGTRGAKIYGENRRAEE